jgi:aminoglycoside/choline kinase family phosphotransferase
VLEALARMGMRNARVETLTPDASDRRYYRATPEAGDSVVVALHVAPFAPGSLPFVQVAGLLAHMSIPVPQVRHELADLGVLVLDDLGDVTLQMEIDARGGLPVHLYEEAVDVLIRLQQRGHELADQRLLPYQLAFDVEKLMWEMDFFITHFLEGFRRCVVSAPARDALRRELLVLSERLAAEPRVLCHRDYHSRNLMVKGGHLFVIDFQDARMGPNTYDLVSLVRDSYVALPASVVEALTERFRRAASPGQSPEAFGARCRVMAMQRNLKALGTFGYQAVARANPVYAQYVPRTLGYVRESFETDARFAPLRDVRRQHVPELR